jgi:hypothetical protein
MMAQTTYDALREANRSLPLSTERRPTVQSEKILSGYAIHEEAFGLVDRLFRLYVKEAKSAPDALFL